MVDKTEYEFHEIEAPDCFLVTTKNGFIVLKKDGMN